MSKCLKDIKEGDTICTYERGDVRIGYVSSIKQTRKQDVLRVEVKYSHDPHDMHKPNAFTGKADMTLHEASKSCGQPPTFARHDDLEQYLLGKAVHEYQYAARRRKESARKQAEELIGACEAHLARLADRKASNARVRKLRLSTNRN